RYAYLQGPLGHHAPLAVTSRARIRNDRACSATGPTGLLDPEESLILNDYPVAVAAPARRRPGAPACPVPGALHAKLFARDGDGLGDAVCCLGEIQFNFDLAIAAALRSMTAAPPAEQVPEQIAKQVEDGLGVAEMRDVQAVQPGVPVAIVALPFVRIAQHFVGFGRFLELQFRLPVADIAVGVELHGQAAIGTLDLLAVRLAADAEDLVIIPFAARG